MARHSFAFGALFGIMAAAAASTTGYDLAWVWFSQCDAPRQFALEMKVDGRLIHSSTFIACFTRRDENKGKQVSFPLSAKKGHFGEAAGTRLDVDVWEAGGEMNGMILGVTFTSANRVWLNTLHFAEIDRPSTSTLAHGIVMKTYPVKNAKAP